MINAPKFSLLDLADGQAPWMELTSPQHNGNTIHMSAANGFTAASYLSFLRQFNENHSITGMDCRGTWDRHDAPANNFTMHHFADDLIQAIDMKHKAPVIGMGHSLGGFVSLLAAIKRPDLFSCLVLIEPASLPSQWLNSIYPHIPKPILFKFMPFIKGSLNRQRVWQKPSDFYDRYRQHNTFKHFTDQSFEDYMTYGLVKKGDQWELRFSPLWEGHIFQIVEFIWNYLPKVTIPTLFIRAEHSHIYSQSQFKRNNKGLPQWVDSIEIEGYGHLLPQEGPDETSKRIKQWLSKFPN